MSIEERKERLVSIILNSSELELIEMLEEDVVHYQQHRQKDPVDELSPEELAELKELMEESAQKDMITFEEFKAEMARWLNPAPTDVSAACLHTSQVRQ